ncbi:MAG: T9SS type A sorting domain-containing protein, partial [bacterium]|nr:T9SS type A sorting domain-containing protein [bacterium]
NSTLTITLDIPLHQEISLSLFDILGREAAVIHRGRLNSTTLNYTTPAHLSSGIYFLRAATNTNSTMQKVVLLK